MTEYGKIVNDGYILAVGIGVEGAISITQSEYDAIKQVIREKPQPVGINDWRLKEDLTWEEYTPQPPTPTTTESEKAYALTRYINEHTGAGNPDLVSAAETLIKTTITEG